MSLLPQTTAGDAQPTLRPRRSQARTIGIASVIWAGSIFLSRMMGLLREQIIGRTLGASREADLYFASFTLPDFLNYLLAAGALSIVFIPIFLEYLERGEHDGGWKSFSVIANFILVVGSIGIGLLMVFARPLASLVAPGFTEPGEVDTLVRLIRIILPAQFFHVIGGLLSAALQAQDLHLLPAMAPLGLLGRHHRRRTGWGALPRNGRRRICVGRAGRLRDGAVCAAALRLPQDPDALVPDPLLPEPDLRRYLWLSFPIMIGFSIVVVDEWIVKNQASYLAAGALSYLQYGRTLMKVPIGVFGMAAGVAAYPTISRMVAAGRVGGGIRPALPCGAGDAVRNVRSASVHDIGRVRGGILGLGFVLQPISALPMRKPREPYWRFCALVLVAGRHKPSSVAGSTRLGARGCQRSSGP